MPESCASKISVNRNAYLLRVYQCLTWRNLNGFRNIAFSPIVQNTVLTPSQIFLAQRQNNCFQHVCSRRESGH